MEKEEKDLTRLDAVTSLYSSPKGTMRKRSSSEFTLTWREGHIML